MIPVLLESLVLGCCLVGVLLIASGRSAGAALPPVDQGASVSAAGRRPNGRLAGALAFGALVWVVGAVLALFFVPMVTTESAHGSSESGEVITTRETSPLFEVGGTAKATALAVAAVVVIVGLRLGRPPQSALFVMGAVAMVFCFVTGFSIGLFFLPVPVLLLAAGAASPAPTPQGTWSQGAP